jgi:hypothetical protein
MASRPFVFLLTGNNVAATSVVDKVLLGFPDQAERSGREVTIISRREVAAASKGARSASDRLERDAAALHELMAKASSVDDDGNDTTLVCLYDYPATQAELSALVEYSEGTQFPLLDAIVRIDALPNRATVLAGEDDDVVPGGGSVAEQDPEPEPAVESVSEGGDDGGGEGGGEHDDEPDADADREEEGELGEPSMASRASSRSRGSAGAGAGADANTFTRTFAPGIPLREYLERITDLKAHVDALRAEREGFWRDVTYSAINVSELRDAVAADLLMPGQATPASDVEVVYLSVCL